MYHLVNDVAAYPEFLPWCGGAKVVHETEGEMVASVTIAKVGLQQTFETRNHLVPGERIEMHLIEGPFKYLKGEWNFKPLDVDACKIQFEVEFEELEEPSPFGLERVRFLFSGSPNLPLSPISESISGGELSRFLLSVLTVFSLPSVTMVFDEIDSGMSGRILKKVAQKLRKISRKQQVIAVTHSPQLVAAADRVFRLERVEDSVRIKELEGDNLIKEIARMVSGDITEGSLKAAFDLLSVWRE